MKILYFTIFLLVLFKKSQLHHTGEEERNNSHDETPSVHSDTSHTETQGAETSGTTTGDGNASVTLQTEVSAGLQSQAATETQIQSTTGSEIQATTVSQSQVTPQATVLQPLVVTQSQAAAALHPQTESGTQIQLTNLPVSTGLQTQATLASTSGQQVTSGTPNLQELLAAGSQIGIGLQELGVSDLTSNGGSGTYLGGMGLGGYYGGNLGGLMGLNNRPGLGAAPSSTAATSSTTGGTAGINSRPSRPFKGHKGNGRFPIGGGRLTGGRGSGGRGNRGEASTEGSAGNSANHGGSSLMLDTLGSTVGGGSSTFRPSGGRGNSGRGNRGNAAETVNIGGRGESSIDGSIANSAGAQGGSLNLAQLAALLESQGVSGLANNFRLTGGRGTGGRGSSSIDNAVSVSQQSLQETGDPPRWWTTVNRPNGRLV